MPVDEEMLRRIADELEIRGLVERYCDALVRRDERDWADTWAEDGTWDVLGNHAEGRAQVVATWTRLVGIFRMVAQVPHHGVLEIEGDRARGRWLVSEHARTVQGDDAVFTLGMYADRYVRTEGRWRFASRRFHPIHTGPPDLSGPLHPLPEDW